MEAGYHYCPYCGHKEVQINAHYNHMENWCEKAPKYEKENETTLSNKNRD